MLSEIGFQAYVTRLGLTDAAVVRLRALRANGPDRRVASHHRNVSGRVPSDKMGETRQVEALSTEGLAILEYETNSTVLEYHDQPGQLLIKCADRKGRIRGFRITADDVVLETDGVYFDEWKTEEELVGLARDWPARYNRDETGWRSIPGEEAAARLGFGFRVRTPSDLDPELVHNGRFLASYRRDRTPVGAETAELIVGLTRTEPGITIGELLSRAGTNRSDDLYRLIERGVIYADLRRFRLSDTFHTRLYASREEAAALARDKDPVARAIAAVGEVLLKAGESVVFDGRICTVAAVSATTVLLRPARGDLLPVMLDELEELFARGVLKAVAGDDGQPISCFPAVSPEAAKEANRRFQILERFWNSRILEVPHSTFRDWQRAYRKAERDGLPGIRGLYPREVGRKEGPQLPEDVEEIVTGKIESFYETLDQPSKKALHDQIAKACQAKGLDAPSYATVLARLKGRDLHDSERARAGRKRAYKSKPFYWHLASDTPRHGERPWERGHIDHTQLDVVLVDSETGLPLGRPWLTLLIDAYSRRILAYWITFDEPSYRALMMVMRRCVERWRRLPEEIIVDGGVEFGSVYFEQLCATYRVSPLVRPGEPRFGSVIERFFGSLNTRFIHLLRGNTKATKNVRELTRETDPANRAVWTLARLAERLDEFFFELYDTLSHPVFGGSPRAVFEARIALTGQRADRLIANDATFRMTSLPSGRKGTATVDRRNRGVKINGRSYNAPEFRAPGIPGSVVAVKFDPADVRRAYAFVDGRWVVCYCQELRRFPSVSEREIGFLSSESYRRLKVHQGHTDGDNRRIADFVADKIEREAVLLQQRKDAQVREMEAAGEAMLAEPSPPELPTLEAPTTAAQGGEPDLVLQPDPVFETYGAYG